MSTLASPTLPSLQVRPLALLTLGHFLVDFCQGLVPTMVPFLTAREGFSYAAAAGLVFAVSASSSVIQPLFGQLADRFAFAWLLPAAVMLAGIALGCGVQTGWYPLMLTGLALSGIGIAAFHPEAARQTHLAAGVQRSTAMSFFSIGGGLGFASAPIVGGMALTAFGRPGLVLVLIPTAIVAPLLMLEFSSKRAAARHAARPARSVNAPDNWTGFWILAVGLVLRSIVFFGLNSFLALYWSQHWHVEVVSGTGALSLFLMGGIFGTLCGGWLADRFGRRRIIQVSFGLTALAAPLAFVAPTYDLGLACLALTSVLFSLSASPSIVMGQEYLPNRVGVASGVTIGLSVSIGGMVAPLLGYVGDNVGLSVVFLILEILLAVCFLATLLLPSPETPEVRATA